MEMKRIYLAAAALTMSAALSYGQNFNPTVEVTNIYQSGQSQAVKPQIEMCVPDSLLRFDLDFDYEVFNKPYQGAYSFKPYVLDMKPKKDAWRGRNLYLKAGAGYALHPQLDFVYSPELKGAFQMSVYANHRSYFGDYHEIVPEYGQEGITLKKSGRFYNGYNSLTTAGFDGVCSWDRTILSFGAGYYGLASKDTVLSRSFNAVDLGARIRSNNSSESYFLYDISLGGRIASDNLDYSSFVSLVGNAPDRIGETSVLMKGLVGPVLDSRRSVLVGFTAESATCSRFFDGSVSRLEVVPSYRVKTGRWDLNLGVKLGIVSLGDASDSLSFKAMDGGRRQIVYPDVHVVYAASPAAVLYADATGGNQLRTYSSQLSCNRWTNPSFLVNKDARLLSLADNTVEAVNGRVGVKGSVASKFTYDLSGGFAVYDNALMDGAVYFQGVLRPCYEYDDFNLLYADASLGFESERFGLDAAFRFRKSFFSEDAAHGFSLPLLSGDFAARYNVTSRLRVGAAVEAASSREAVCSGDLSGRAEDVTLPGYVDLGVNCAYRFNRKIELWLDSGNLLCQTVQRNPFYAERGLWATLGFTLNL